MKNMRFLFALVMLISALTLLFVQATTLDIYASQGMLDPYIEWTIDCDYNQNEYLAEMHAYPGGLPPSVDDYEFEWWIKSLHSGNVWSSYTGWGPHQSEMTFDEIKGVPIYVYVKCTYYFTAGGSQTIQSSTYVLNCPEP